MGFIFLFLHGIPSSNQEESYWSPLSLLILGDKASQLLDFSDTKISKTEFSILPTNSSLPHPRKHYHHPPPSEQNLTDRVPSTSASTPIVRSWCLIPYVISNIGFPLTFAEFRGRAPYPISKYLKAMNKMNKSLDKTALFSYLDKHTSIVTQREGFR